MGGGPPPHLTSAPTAVFQQIRRLEFRGAAVGSFLIWKSSVPQDGEQRPGKGHPVHPMLLTSHPRSSLCVCSR